QVQTHSSLETHGSLARWEGDQLTVWSSTQATFGVRDQVAQALKIPKDKVRVICEYMGGGFGSKFNAGPFTIIAAKLAQKAGAPVKTVLSGKEKLWCTGTRPDSVQHVKMGAKGDGTLLARHLKAYAPPGVGTGAGVSRPAKAIYKWPAWRT